MKLLLMVRPAKISHGGAVASWLVGCLTMDQAGIMVEKRLVASIYRNRDKPALMDHLARRETLSFVT